MSHMGNVIGGNMNEKAKLLNNEQDNLTKKNVELVQKVYAAFVKRDIGSILALLSTDVVWKEPDNPFNPAAGTRYGHSGFLEWANIGNQSEDILVLEPHKFLAKDDTVAVIGFMKCLAKPTGKIYDSDFVHLVTLKNQQITYFEEFFDTYVAAEAFRREGESKD
jgi:ketosteroid isomerase-like protein